MVNKLLIGIVALLLIAGIAVLFVVLPLTIGFPYDLRPDDGTGPGPAPPSMNGNGNGNGGMPTCTMENYPLNSQTIREGVLNPYFQRLSLPFLGKFDRITKVVRNDRDKKIEAEMGYPPTVRMYRIQAQYMLNGQPNPTTFAVKLMFDNDPNNCGWTIASRGQAGSGSIGTNEKEEV